MRDFYLLFFILFIVSCGKEREQVSFEYHLKNIAETIEQPRILLPSTEPGNPIKLINGELTERSALGGLGTVTTDYIIEYPIYLKNLGKKAEVSFCFMAYEGKTYGQHFTDLTIQMGSQKQLVEVYHAKTEDDANIYYFKNPAFTRRKISNPYVYHDGTVMFTNFNDLEQTYDYILFSKSIAELSKKIHANVIHLNDYHSALTAFYVSKNRNTTITIHNSGIYYRGEVFTGGNIHKLATILNIMGINWSTYEKYLRDKRGELLLLNSIHYIVENNLLGGMPVSPGYAKELLLTRKEIIEIIKREKNGKGPKIPKNLFVFNGGMKYPFVKGYFNGLGHSNHASTNPLLKKVENWDEADPDDKITPEVRNMWTEDLNYSEKNPRNVHAKKALLKKMLQINYGLQQNPDAPLFTLLSRISEQKNLPIFIENIQFLVENGAQVVIGGPGKIKNVNENLKELERKYPQNVKFISGTVFGREKILVQAAADFSPITSLFEPCGLTDVESAWLGTVILGHRTGGLGKIKSGIYYSWHDNTDPEGEIKRAQKDIFEPALHLYKNEKEIFLQKRIDSMQEDFPWQKTIAFYHKIYIAIAINKALNWIHESDLDKDIAEKKIENIIKTINNKTYLDFYKSIIREKSEFEHRQLNSTEQLFVQFVEKEMK